MQAVKSVSQKKNHFIVFIHDVSDYDRAAVASISLLIKWKNNNRKSIVGRQCFLSLISFIARHFYYFLIYFSSIYLFFIVFLLLPENLEIFLLIQKTDIFRVYQKQIDVN